MDEQWVPEDEDIFSSYQTANAKPAEKPVPFIGLRNLGNSCYFNSVLQVLLHCPVLTKCINLYAEEAEKFVAENEHNDCSKKMKYDDCNKKKCKVFCEFLVLCKDMCKKQLTLIAKGCRNGVSASDYVLEPKLLLENLQSVYPSFEPFAQQDAQECLQCFLDILHDSILMFNNIKEIDYTPFAKIEPVKVLGGGKFRNSVAISNGDYDVNNTLKNTKAVKPDTARKRGIKSLFKSPLKHLRESDKENTLPQQNSVTSFSRNNASNITSCTATNSSRTSIIQKTKLLIKRKASFALEDNKDSILPSLKEVPINFKKKELAELLRLKVGYDLAYVSGGIGGRNEEGCDMEKFNKTFVESLFQGEIVNESRCIECENSRLRVETFMDVSIPVCPNDKKNSEFDKSPNVSTQNSSVGSRCSVSWGMASFASREMLNGENKYYCDACKRYCEGERRLLLNRLPPLLTFHLKRFTSCLDGESSLGVSVSKINTCFEVPLKLSLKEWCSESCKDHFDYDLFAIIVHSGTTVCSGHYLAYIKIHHNTMHAFNDVVLSKTLESYYGQWLETDDERVRIISDEKFQEVISRNNNEETSRTPYLLFYCNNAMN